jgi:anti-sigma regulatory factor (Ser/Thr protein kinase)
MIAVQVQERSQIAEVRRKVVQLGTSNGFKAEELDRAALIVTELATNVIKHGGGGQVLVDASARGIDLIALDRGRGMADATVCAADGFSTAGTLGHGLGAMRRQADEFLIASWPDRGTAVLARVWPTGQTHRSDPPGNAAAVVVAKPGEEACGDAWSLRAGTDSVTVFVVDGLGHGTEAARAAHEAVLQFQRTGSSSVAQIVDEVHRALQSTRGGAVAVAQVDGTSALLTFAGLGNISATIVAGDGKTRRMVSLNGTAGHNARKIQPFEYPGARGLLIMHSDGIDTRWSLDRYPGVHALDPLLIAALLYRDHSRNRDDATVVVVRL